MTQVYLYDKPAVVCWNLRKNILRVQRKIFWTVWKILAVFKILFDPFYLYSLEILKKHCESSVLHSVCIGDPWENPVGCDSPWWPWLFPSEGLRGSTLPGELGRSRQNQGSCPVEPSLSCWFGWEIHSCEIPFTSWRRWARVSFEGGDSGRRHSGR